MEATNWRKKLFDYVPVYVLAQKTKVEVRTPVVDLQKVYELPSVGTEYSSPLEQQALLSPLSSPTFICWWTAALVLFLSFCEQYIYKHGYTTVSAAYKENLEEYKQEWFI